MRARGGGGAGTSRTRARVRCGTGGGDERPDRRAPPVSARARGMGEVGARDGWTEGKNGRAALVGRMWGGKERREGKKAAAGLGLVRRLRAALGRGKREGEERGKRKRGHGPGCQGEKGGKEKGEEGRWPAGLGPKERREREKREKQNKCF
jgi:hypothetical protein